MKTDYQKLTAVVKESGMTAPWALVIARSKGWLDFTSPRDERGEVGAKRRVRGPLHVRGLGYRMIQVQCSLDTPAMVMTVVLLTVLGVTLYGLVPGLERLLVVRDIRLQ
jgi:hypothetical protein